MKWRHLLFYLLLLAGAFSIMRIVRVLTNGFLDNEGSALDYGIRISISLLVISGCCIIAKKQGLLRLGGFRGGRLANYWMLLLPLLFPGLMMFKLKNYHCIDLTLFYFIFILHKLLAAAMEETLFRGVILGHLQKHYPGLSVHFYCFVSATLFSLVHLTNLQTAPLLSVIPQLVYAFILGLLFAAMMLRIRNVWLLGVTHGVLNIMTVNVCKELSQTLSGQDIDTSGSILMAALGFLIILLPVLGMYFLLVISYRKETHPGNFIKNSTQRNED